MTTKQRYQAVIEWFDQNMPDVRTELNYGTPFELLVAVILSAQCTDKRINQVTPPLLQAYPTAEAMAKASAEEIYKYIKSVTYPNNKARSLVGMANALVDKHGGQVPDNIDELTQIPGVGRKTANVMLSVAFGKAAMAVDTHVFRVSNRIGLTDNSPNPLATEKTLVKNIPEAKIGKAHHWLILHGRYVCTARKPHCHECGLRPFCKFYNSSGNQEK